MNKTKNVDLRHTFTTYGDRVVTKLAPKTLESDLTNKSTSELKGTLSLMVERIRYHRNQKGDDRCWVDDEYLYKLLAEHKPLTELPSREKMTRMCETFHARRQAKGLYQITATGKSSRSLNSLDNEELTSRIVSLRQAIREHQSKGGRRTAEDDRKLYAALDESAVVDTSLPEARVFLPNCMRFWETRQEQHPQKIHEW